jgi:hypothetical protein
MYIENTKKSIGVIVQGNVDLLVSVLLLTKVFCEFVEFKGIDTHAYTLLLIQ